MESGAAGHSALVTRLRAIVGTQGVVTDEADMAPHLVDWRGRNRGRSFAVVKPATTEEVAAVVRLCAETRTPIVPQGGNTGQCAAAVPSEDGGELVLCLSRMNRIIERDAENSAMVVEAGCILATIQAAALEMDRYFPLSLGAEGSCQIGGNLSTNAGGTSVLRFGNARDLVLGLEVVLPDGTVLDCLKALRKNNTGYDLKQLFLGAEGTLGIITKAVLKLFPRPKASATAFAAVRDPAAAVTLLGAVRGTCGDRLTGFEIISRRCLDILFRNLPQFSDPLPQRHDWYVLAELSDPLAGADLRTALETALATGMEQGLVADAVIAASDVQARTLWRMREELPEALRRECPWVRHDVSVPVSRIVRFMEQAGAALELRFPGVRIVAFGHIGDGNIHFNASAPEGMAPEAFVEHAHEVYEIVHDLIATLDGSFSAEHGIGLIKRGEMHRYKSAPELALMRRLKEAMDPAGLMNPGKVF